MRVSIDRTRWWETPLAAMIFFTRLPFWRIAEPGILAACGVDYWRDNGWNALWSKPYFPISHRRGSCHSHTYPCHRRIA